MLSEPWTLLAVLTLAVLGELNLVAIGDYDLALHQAAAVGIGLALMAAARRSRSDSWPWLGRAAYAVAVGMLLAVLLTGARAYGAQRWLSVGSLVLQPSELAKLGLLLVLADVLTHVHGTRGRLFLAGLAAAAPIGLTLLQPDLSTTILLAVVLVAALLLGRIPLPAIAKLLAGGLLLTPVAARSLHAYQVARLHAFLSGHADPGGAGYSTLQAHVAIASGGFFGSHEAPIHQLMAQYLPARQTDLAFASLVEQWGMLAGGLALAAVLVIIWRLVATARTALTPHGGLIAGGLAVLLAAEVSISVAGNLGKAPLAGVPFPLLSYGGTAASAHLAALGLALSARRDAQERRLWRFGARRPSPRLIRLTGTALSALLVSLGAVTWHEQLVEGESLSSFGYQQMTRCSFLPAQRGLIEDRHGVPVATDDERWRVQLVPALLLEDPTGVSRLAALSGQDPAELHRRLESKATAISLSLGDIPADAGPKLQAAALPGVEVIPSIGRHYPYGSLLGPLLGFTGVVTAEDPAVLRALPPGSTVGRSGLERQYDSLLRGRDGYQCVYVNPQGLPVGVAGDEPPARGSTLRLTLDLGLQQQLTQRLDRALREGAPGQPKGDLAAAVMMDGRSGEILALASLPSYDDNLLGPPINQGALAQLVNQPGFPMLEHATQVALPPGSTFKLVVAAADTVYGSIPPAQVIPTGYYFTMGSSTFHGWGYLPPQNLPQAIAWSNDVYFYKLGLELGPERMAEVAVQLGAGRRTDIDLPGEIAGLVGTPADMERLGATWWPATTAFMGIGQAYTTATPLQVARWTAAVAGGRLVTPHLGLGRGLGDAGQVAALNYPPPAALPFAGSLGPVQDGMRRAVTEGTADLLRDNPLVAGGKTGSAEDPSTAGGVDAWFTSAAPFNDPEIVTTVLIRGGGEGHLTSEPAAADVLRYYAANRASIRATPPMVRPDPVDQPALSLASL